MAYSVKMFNQITGEFQCYMEVSGRSQWVTLRTATKHAKEFSSNFPGVVCAVVDAETDDCQGKITGLSFNSDGLRLYSRAGCVLVPRSAVRIWAGCMGVNDVFESLGLGFVRAIEAKRDAMVLAAG